MRTTSSMQRMRGISLLEVLLSLSIIAIILVMATRYYFVASHNDKVNTTVTQIGGLIAAIHNYKGIDATYEQGTNIATLAHAGQLSNFPGYDSSSALNTRWGGAITLSTTSSIATLKVELPDEATCLTLLRAFPSDSNNNIVSRCDGHTFAYAFP